MQNKEIINGIRHDRPCFYAFPDSKYEKLFWCVPISSKVEKYQDVFDKKIQKYGKCNTIRFGDVMGQKRAFLIQNMFPITKDYIADVYIDRNTNKEVTIEPKISKDIQTNAREVLKLNSRGIPVIFPDVQKIKTALIQQLEKTHNSEYTPPSEPKLEKEKAIFNHILMNKASEQCSQKSKEKIHERER
jgi:hypothetical protein